MPDDRFEDRLRALAEQLSRSISDVDLDDVADRLGVDPDRVRGAAGAVEGWLAGRTTNEGPLFGDAARPSHPPRDAQPGPSLPPRRPLAPGGPHPLDLPSDEQGRTLSALDSGRWTVRPGSSRLSVAGPTPPGPAPPDAGPEPSDLVNELRARDWITADGAVTLVGRQALLRWCQTAGGAPPVDEAPAP